MPKSHVLISWNEFGAKNKVVEYLASSSLFQILPLIRFDLRLLIVEKVEILHTYSKDILVSSKHATKSNHHRPNFQPK